MPAAFIGEVKTLWLKEEGPDRRMTLIESFAFVDPNGKRWDAPAGHVIDGASIPQFLWSLAGSPYIGDYRRASVLHDVACDAKTEPSKAVHRMFYDAMICDGVSEPQALEFYTAVRLFGPSWTMQTGGAKGIFITKATARPVRTIQQVEDALDAVLAE